MAPAPHRSPRTEWQETGLAQAADNALNSAGWRHHTSRGESVSWPVWSPRRILLKFLSIFLLKNVWNLKYIFLPLRFLFPLGFCWSWWPFLFSQSHLQHLCVSWCPWRKSVKPVEWVWLYVNKRNHCVYSNLFKWRSVRTHTHTHIRLTFCAWSWAVVWSCSSLISPIDSSFPSVSVSQESSLSAACSNWKQEKTRDTFKKERETVEWE